MKLTTFEIKFDNPNGFFEAGKNLSGVVHFQITKPMKMRSMKLYFVGEGKTHWDKNKGGQNKAKYRARETYLHHSLTLVVARPTEGSIEHPAGNHMYPFSIHLLDSIPSSYEGKGGYVRYFCKATVDRPWKSNSHVKRIFTVIHHMDLNTVPVAVPFYGEKSQTLEGCCFDDGSIDVSLELDKLGYVPGEPLVYKVKARNHSSFAIRSMTLELRQIATVTAYSESVFSSGTPKYKEFTSPFFLYNGVFKVKPNATGELHKATIVPSLPPSRLDGCKIIDLKYFVILKVSCGSTSAKVQTEVIIGTIPVRDMTLIPTAPTGPAQIEPVGDKVPAPPSYEEALAPPPSYAECVFGTSQVRDENDDDNTDGDVMWAPVYPYYNWSAHSTLTYGGEPPAQAQMGLQEEDHDDDDDDHDESGNDGPGPSQL